MRRGYMYYNRYNWTILNSYSRSVFKSWMWIILTLWACQANKMDFLKHSLHKVHKFSSVALPLSAVYCQPLQWTSHLNRSEMCTDTHSNISVITGTAKLQGHTCDCLKAVELERVSLQTLNAWGLLDWRQPYWNCINSVENSQCNIMSEAQR